MVAWINKVKEEKEQIPKNVTDFYHHSRAKLHTDKRSYLFNYYRPRGRHGRFLATVNTLNRINRRQPFLHTTISHEID